MLTLSSVIVDYTFRNVFLTFFRPILQAGPPNVVGPRVNYPLLSLLTNLGALVFTRTTFILHGSLHTVLMR